MNTTTPVRIGTKPTYRGLRGKQLASQLSNFERISASQLLHLASKRAMTLDHTVADTWREAKCTLCPSPLRAKTCFGRDGLFPGGLMGSLGGRTEGVGEVVSNLGIREVNRT